MTSCFIFHEIAINLSIQERLYEEIIKTNEELDGQPLTFEALQKMKYLDMVLSETLRKWPPIFTLDRRTTKQYWMETEDGQKALIKPNDILWLPTFAIQRDERYWPNPDLFDPDRFSDENKTKIRPGTYIPFGIGPRACMGSRFVLLQIKAMVYHVLMEFCVERSENTQHPLELTGAGLTIKIKGGFFNRFKLRN